MCVFGVGVGVGGFVAAEKVCEGAQVGQSSTLRCLKPGTSYNLHISESKS